MNWLAHLYLAENSPGFRFGSLAPDFPIDSDCLARLGPEAARGADHHRQINAFTDSHPLVRQSIARISPPWRRYGGILTDIFYDHFLTLDWNAKSGIALAPFLAEVYRSFDLFTPLLPLDVSDRLRQMRDEDWLNSYGTFEGIELTLKRVSRRFRKPTDLAPATNELRRNYEGLRADFDAFFPQLRAASNGRPLAACIRRINDDSTMKLASPIIPLIAVVKSRR